ncbi:hypothetical protein NUBL13783_00890 [Klebsiella pneumoniae]|nr:hypothetical protein KP2271_00270 [Klebsiella pneumoniae]GKO52196.1 hypothetical protein NUBL17193_11230 [Klebsiella pneumoniae]GKP65442.1 hypothetical protein NUBL13783_00890 [Klebsiella pneumoniae]
MVSFGRSYILRRRRSIICRIPDNQRGGKMLMLNVVNGEKEEDDATRAPESGDKQPERDK